MAKRKKKKSPQEGEVPGVFNRWSFVVTQRVGEYCDARNTGQLPTPDARKRKAEELLKGLPQAFQAEFLERIELHEAIKSVRGEPTRAKDQRS